MAEAAGAASRWLVLVKHSLPEVVPGVPASQWQLGPAGRGRCAALAEHLRPYLPAAIVASAEPKAAETARLVAGALGVEWSVQPGLHEHARESVGWLRPEAFEASVKALFARPAERVFGEESAAEALARFSAAVSAALAQHPDENVVVVAHGTVIALYCAAAAGADGFDLWRRLGLPGLVALERPTLRLARVVETAG